MTLKMNMEQNQALYSLLGKVVNEPVSEIKDSLVIDLLRPIYEKLKRRQSSKLNNHGWNLAVTEVQAKSFYAFFEGRYLGDKYLYEQIIIDQHLKAIDKIYG